METEKRVSKTSLLFEVRHRMRSHIALETLLLEQTDLLPEDHFGAEPRDCFQLGAAQAFLDAGPDALFATETIGSDINPSEIIDEHTLDQIKNKFYVTRPYNKYSEEYYFDPSELEAFVQAYQLVNQAARQVTPDVAS